jgi:HEAT repeat protein
VALPDLIGALKDGNDLVRRLAADALTRVGTAGKSDLPLLKTALGESSPEVQLYALGALGRLGAEGQEALPAVVISLTARDARVREQAVRTTVLVGASSRREVLAAVDKTLQDPEKTVRVAAAEVLVRDLALTEADVPRLLALLQHSDWEVRGHGARGLGKVGAAAKEAAPTLLAVLKEASEPALRRALLEALSGVGAESKEMIPALQKALQDPDLDLRLGALDAVGKLGPGAKDLASDLLVKALKEADTRQPALAALTVLGSNAPRGLARTVVGYLTDKESRPQVLAALVALKPSGDEAVSAASRMMDLFAEEKRIEQRGKLADAIARLGKPVIPVVIKYLDNGDPLLRLGAAATLTQIGPPARPALSRLYVHMNTDSIVEVRKECAQAITRIQGGR